MTNKKKAMWESERKSERATNNNNYNRALYIFLIDSQSDCLFLFSYKKTKNVEKKKQNNNKKEKQKKKN